MENSKISWTDHTFNPWFGCVKVSPLCDNCYAERDDKRYSGTENTHWGADARRRFMGEAYWQNPVKWNKQAEKEGVRKRVFCMSMGDFFERLPGSHPDYDEMILARIRATALMRDTPCLDWLLLTKRLPNVRSMVPWAWMHGDWPRNVWMGGSAGTQAEVNRNVPVLLSLRAPIEFLSMEPLLGECSLTNINLSESGDVRLNALTGQSFTYDVIGGKMEGSLWPSISWVITGGESGSNARPSHPDWFRKLRDECVAAGVPFHFKQWGEIREALAKPESEQPGTFIGYMTEDGDFFPAKEDWHSFVTDALLANKHAVRLYRVGKQGSGHLLDGREWLQFPKWSLYP